MEREHKVVLTGSYEGSYTKFRGANKAKKNIVSINVIKLVVDKIKNRKK